MSDPTVTLVDPLPSGMPSLVKTLLLKPESVATSTEYVAVEEPAEGQLAHLDSDAAQRHGMLGVAQQHELVLAGAPKRCLPMWVTSSRPRPAEDRA